MKANGHSADRINAELWGAGDDDLPPFELPDGPIETDVDPRDPSDEEAERQAREQIEREQRKRGSPRQDDQPADDPPHRTAADELGGLLDRLRRGEGDVLFSAGDQFEGFEFGPGKITVVGAPPATGKTAFSMGATFEALKADDDLRAFVANAEMPFEVLLKRELTRLTGVPAKALRFADLTDRQMAEVEAAAMDLQPLLARIDVMQPPFTIGRLAKIAHDRPGLVVVDYLQKFGTEGSDARAGATAVMTALRTLAHAGWAVLALSATTRSHGKGGSSHDGSKLTLASFKESGEIEFNADAAYLLRDEGPDDGNERVRKVTLDCVKNRHGERHKFELVFDMPAMTFRQREPEPFDFGEFGDNPFSGDDGDAELFERHDNTGSHD